MKSFSEYLYESYGHCVLLWIDDIRDPNLAKWQSFIKSAFRGKHISDIVWVKSYKEFKEWVDKNGLPNLVSFDHDLGDVENPDNEKTGYDCCKYLIDFCMDNDCDFPQYAIQSDNGPGSDNIDKYIKNFQKHCR